MPYPVAEIEVRVIPHEKQRYDTCGDWLFRKIIGEQRDILSVTVSALPDPRMEHAVMLHEIAEALLCRQAGIEERLVTAFDTAYEANRKEGDTSEPGDSPDAPYRAQHQMATSIERLFIISSGLSWSEYEAAVDNLPRHATLSL